MKYCFFSAQYPPTVGGVENHTFRLAEKVVQRGGHAVVVTSALPKLPLYEKTEAGVEVLRLPSWLLGGGRLPVLKPGAETRRAFQKLAHSGIDRAVIQTRLYPLSLVAARFCKKQKIPAIVIEHGHAYTATGKFFPDLGLKIYTGLLLRAVHRSCPRFYAVSQGAADWLLAHGVQVKGLFYNAVSLQAVQQALAVPCRDFRTECALPHGALAVAYTGRLVEAKGVPQLVEAVKRWNRAGKQEMHLFLAGEGELAPALRDEEDPRIHFLGRLAFDEVCALLAACDWMCLPTALPEGLPSSALEAGACGVCVVGTSMGGLREIVPGPEFGLLLEDNRPETLLKAFEKLAEDPAYRKKAGQNLQARVKEHFTFDALEEKLQNLPWEADE